MIRPSKLSKAQLTKFVEGFNQLIANGPQINRYGYKKDGMEFARTLVLYKQLNGVENAHQAVGTQSLNTDWVAMEREWIKCADYFGYADLLCDS